VEISSGDGARLRIRPLGYQFGVAPPSDPDESEDWDDWLVVAGEATAADGRSWSFSDPCLTADEARDLAAWLRRPVDGDGPSAPMLFTEPNLAFRVGPGRSPLLSLDVDFSHESLPPWLPGEGLGRVYSLRLDVAPGDLVRAADQWADEIALFPRRTA
jgi:hypothetical protein